MLVRVDRRNTGLRGGGKKFGQGGYVGTLVLWEEGTERRRGRKKNRKDKCVSCMFVRTTGRMGRNIIEKERKKRQETQV